MKTGIVIKHSSFYRGYCIDDGKVVNVSDDMDVFQDAADFCAFRGYHVGTAVMHAATYGIADSYSIQAIAGYLKPVKLDSTPVGTQAVMYTNTDELVELDVPSYYKAAIWQGADGTWAWSNAESDKGPVDMITTGYATKGEAVWAAEQWLYEQLPDNPCA